MAVTISGPPTTTERLFRECEALSDKHRVPIPIYAPYHADHLFSTADVSRIFDGDSRRLLQQLRPGALIHSAATGKCHQVTTSLELFEQVISEILRETREMGLPFGGMCVANRFLQYFRMHHFFLWSHQCRKQFCFSVEGRRPALGRRNRSYIVENWTGRTH